MTKPAKIKKDSIPVIKSRGGEIQILISPKTTATKQMILGFSVLGLNEAVKPHVHDYSDECFFVIKGQGAIYFSEHESINFSSGDCVFVPRGTIHWIKNTGLEEMQVVFAASPLAPNPELGHREINIEGESNEKSN